MKRPGARTLTVETGISGMANKTTNTAWATSAQHGPPAMDSASRWRRHGVKMKIDEWLMVVACMLVGGST